MAELNNKSFSSKRASCKPKMKENNIQVLNMTLDNKIQNVFSPTSNLNYTTLNQNNLGILSGEAPTDLSCTQPISIGKDKLEPIEDGDMSITTISQMDMLEMPQKPAIDYRKLYVSPNMLNNNPGTRLYTKGVAAKSVKEQFLEEMRRIKEAKELSNTTFVPGQAQEQTT